MDDDDSTTTDYMEKTTYNNSSWTDNMLVIYEKNNITIERFDNDDTRPQVEANTDQIWAQFTSGLYLGF
ncbi:MAG: hypothetical protein U5K00_07830 [Melioribacteraceae bacterium]|nr:hypothetical protein [Melioribacteraceae bacterium]